MNFEKVSRVSEDPEKFHWPSDRIGGRFTFDARLALSSIQIRVKYDPLKFVENVSIF